MTVHDPISDPLYRDPQLADFYDLENGWGPDFDFCVKFAEGAESVLDLGCGTGELTTALAQGRAVTGVDPAGAMLEIARRRPGGKKIAWVEGDARDLSLGRRFDLVLLTGHAFQVFLTPEDQAAALATIARHLTPGGRFLFDSRNPAAEAWKAWRPEPSRRALTHPVFGEVEAWNDAVHDPASDIVTYETHYRAISTGKHLSAASQIKFTDQADLARLIEAAGLEVDRWLGDWQGNAFSPNAREIIPIGGLKQR